MNGLIVMIIVYDLYNRYKLTISLTKRSLQYTFFELQLPNEEEGQDSETTAEKNMNKDILE